MEVHPGSVTPSRRFMSEAVSGPDGRVSVGIDIGSVSSSVVLVDSAGSVLWSDYKRTAGRPIETVRLQLRELFGSCPAAADVELAAATGSAGRFAATLVGIPFVSEVSAQAAAVAMLFPGFGSATIIEMGGQDSKLIYLRRSDGRAHVRDVALNSVCAAGTGSFLDQQAQRLGVSIEDEFGSLALASRSVPRIAGRCSVFAKTDMIHLQQQATPTGDIIAGLCMALARNLKSNLGCGRSFDRPLVFTGGVAANAGVVRAIEQVFGLGQGALVVPRLHFFTGALGAVLVARGRAAADFPGLNIKALDEYLTGRGAAIEGASRRPPLRLPEGRGPAAYRPPAAPPDGAIEAFLGVDVGSISTNVVVIDRRNRVLAKAYLMTAGRPLEAVRQGLQIVGRQIGGGVSILSAAATGSGRYLTGDFVGADVVVNEITAQAAGAALVNPEVDTIFEIGGQDSKYIALDNGVVVDFEMNHACAAGTGSFLEEQAQRLGIDIKTQFAELALESRSPIKLGERCTVFMESDLLNYQQQGADIRDLVAGLSYSIVSNYLNRVVGRRRIGSNICFQGGTAFNKAVWSAFEAVTGKNITVPDHHEVTGALGAAAIAARRYIADCQTGRQRESSFRGFDRLITGEYKVESFTCEHCPNHCEIKKVQLPSAEPLYYGSRCDRYNRKSGRKPAFQEAFEYRNKMLFECAGLSRYSTRGGTATVGIPRALLFWQFLPLFSRFFQELGFDVVLSGATDKRIIRMGVEAVTAQPCFPVKVAHGHVAELIDKGLDYILLPSIVSVASGGRHGRGQLCPYVQSLPYQMEAAFTGRLGQTRILKCDIHMGEGRSRMLKDFVRLAAAAGVSGAAVPKALKSALAAQKEFERSLAEKGRRILDRIEPDKMLFVLICRPYNGCDEGMNLQLARKLAELGVEVIPMDMLDLEGGPTSEATLDDSVYWMYGRKILRAAEIIKRDDRLFAIYLSNFGCGPDSFITAFFRDIMGGDETGSRKPSLQLELDEHSADAGLITRLEAFLDSLRHYRRSPEPRRAAVVTGPAGPDSNRRLYIPYMGDCAYAMAACFRAWGRPAEVMPMADQSALLAGRAHTSGKECLPCAITTGDMLKVVGSEGFDPRKAAFFMPGGAGPCRFGMYNSMHRLILKRVGAGEAAVISPNQDSGFYRQIAAGVDTGSSSRFLKEVWSALVGVDLLGKALLRLRPFALDPGAAERCYRDCLSMWIDAVEARRPARRLRKLMEQFADSFGAVAVDKTLRKPLVGIVGEIYVRNHPFANSFVIKRLERLGAACELASVAEWIYYTNFTRKRTAAGKKHLGEVLTNIIQDRFQRRIEAVFAEPLQRRFGSLVEPPVRHTIELARPYIHDSFEGEAILSVGKMVEFYKTGFGGVVNVMPFSCMPSTIVSGQCPRLARDCAGMPILNLSFDGQEDATLETRLETFVEQIRSRNKGQVLLAELTAGGR